MFVGYEIWQVRIVCDLQQFDSQHDHFLLFKRKEGEDLKHTTPVKIPSLKFLLRVDFLDNLHVIRSKYLPFREKIRINIKLHFVLI